MKNNCIVCGKPAVKTLKGQPSTEFATVHVCEHCHRELSQDLDKHKRQVLNRYHRVA